MKGIEIGRREFAATHGKGSADWDWFELMQSKDNPWLGHQVDELNCNLDSMIV